MIEAHKLLLTLTVAVLGMGSAAAADFTTVTGKDPPVNIF